MKAVYYNRYGSPDVLELKAVETPVPKDDEVLIKVHAASVNSWDWDLLRGRPLLYRLFFGLFKPKLKIIGADIAGQVEVIGKNVKQLKPGDHVFGDISGCSWGGFAEYVCAHENALAIKSPKMTFEEAAAIPQAGVMALQGLRYKRQIQKGENILINGAGGGVGTFAIQMAKSLGAEVTGVDSAEKLDMIRSVGADHVIDCKQEDFTKNGKRYDMILDVVAHRSIFAHSRALKPNGIYVVIGGAIPALLQTAFVGPLLSLFSKKKVGLLVHRPNQKDLDFITAQFESGKVRPVIDKRYPLNETTEAFRYFGSGRVQGKVVITV